MHIKLDILRIRRKYFSEVSYNKDGEGKVHLETVVLRALQTMNLTGL